MISVASLAILSKTTASLATASSLLMHLQMVCVCHKARRQLLQPAHRHFSPGNAHTPSLLAKKQGELSAQFSSSAQHIHARRFIELYAEIADLLQTLYKLLCDQAPHGDRARTA